MLEPFSSARRDPFDDHNRRSLDGAPLSQRVARRVVASVPALATRSEWQDHLKTGALTHLDVAFSRDQPEKIYVQHKLIEQASVVWQWLENGAHFYVCGDASRMAKDVQDALLEIIATQGDMNADEADAYLAALKKDKRYQRDVY